jgi:predicted DNA-binding transcriptional regulator AlpA
MRRRSQSRFSELRTSRVNPTERLPNPDAAEAETVANSTDRPRAAVERMLTSPEASRLLRVSHSWLAKSRMRGDGPPYAKIGRSVRYAESTLLRWMKSQQRLATDQ